MNTIIAPHSRVKSVVWTNIPKRTKGWTNADALRSAQEFRDRKEVKEFIYSLRPTAIKKTARVRKLKTSYHVTGFGLLNMEKKDLYNFLKGQGYSRVRIGGLMFNI